MQTSRTNNEWYPLQVQLELKNDWLVIWENGKQIFLGRGYERKVWDFDLHKFLKLTNGVQFLGKDGHMKGERW